MTLPLSLEADGRHDEEVHSRDPILADGIEELHGAQFRCRSIACTIRVATRGGGVMRYSCAHLGFLVSLLIASSASAVTMAWTPIGNPGGAQRTASTGFSNSDHA